MPRRRSRRGGTVALSAATAGPRCAPIIMDYVRRRPRAGNSAVRSRRTGAAARPQGPNGRNTVNSYYHISIKSVHTSYTQHGETMENGSVVRFVPTVNGSDRRVSGGPEGAQSPKWAKPPHIQEHSRGGRSQKSSAVGAHPPRAQPHRCQNVFEDRAQRLTLRCRMRFLTRTGCCTYFWFPQNGSVVVSRCGFVSFFSR